MYHCVYTFVSVNIPSLRVFLLSFFVCGGFYMLEIAVEILRVLYTECFSACGAENNRNVFTHLTLEEEK